MRLTVVVAVAVVLGGCSFVNKIGEGIQCNEPASAFMDGSGHPSMLKRPPAQDCAYWLKPHG